MTILYLICVIISLFMYLWLCLTDVKRSIFQNAMVLIMLLSNIGFLTRNLSTNLNEAILSHKIVYLGGCFLPYLYFLTMLEVCHIRMKKWVTIILAIVQAFIFALVCSIGYTGIYYKSVDFLRENGYVTLIKEYGPLHFLYPFTMFLYFLGSIATSIVTIRSGKKVYAKGLFMMILFISIAILCYCLNRYGILEYDLMPFAYIILMTMTLVPLYYTDIFTVNENEDIVKEELEKAGFITFNKKMKFMGCNDNATMIFPELNEFKIGKKNEPKTKKLKKMVDAISVYSERSKKVNENDALFLNHMSFKIEDNYYEARVHNIKNFLGLVIGYTIEIVDETEHNKVIELTTKYNENLSREVEEKTERIRTIQENTILGMAQMVESRDLSTGGHIKRTSDVVKIFAKKLLDTTDEFTFEYLKLVERSAPMHDLGKIGVDDFVLRKQGRFTDSEYDLMKKHAEIGGKMVNDILSGVEEKRFVSIAGNVAKYHHERYDGKGYPNGLSGTDIPLESRIMALADVFDALVSKRCYKEAFSYDEAFNIIENGMGTQFDPNLTKIFLSCRKELEEYYNKQE